MGIYTDGFGTTKIAGKARLDRSLDPDMARIFQASTENIYRQFIELVDRARGFNNDMIALDKVAQGRVWSGEQAMARDLVDKTGTFQDAIEASARIAGLGDNYKVEWVEPERSALDEFFMEFMTGAMVKLNLSVSKPVKLPVSWLQSMLEDLRFIAARDGQFTVAAHCLCNFQ